MFIPDLTAVTLDYHPERGIGFSRLGIHLSGNSMVGHIMAVESGTYKKAHRHGPGAQVIVIAGKGYSLMWPPGANLFGSIGSPEACSCRRKVGTIIISPPAKNPPAISRYVAVSARWAILGARTWSEHEGGHLLEHEDEPPEIRAIYEARAKKEGVPFRMKPIAPSANRNNLVCATKPPRKGVVVQSRPRSLTSFGMTNRFHSDRGAGICLELGVRCSSN